MFAHKDKANLLKSVVLIYACATDPIPIKKAPYLRFFSSNEPLFTQWLFLAPCLLFHASFYSVLHLGSFYVRIYARLYERPHR